jgi:hypothetical protein
MIIYGSELATTLNGRRSGVIPFVKIKEKFHFLFGIDRASRELTDFGGCVAPEETLLEAAFREFEEESCGIFEEIVTIKNVEESLAIVNEHFTEAIFLVNVPVSFFSSVNKMFVVNQQQFSGSRKHNELIGIKWVSEDHLKNIAFEKSVHVLWTRVQKMFCENTTWIELKIHLMISNDLIKTIQKTWQYISQTSLVKDLFIFD